MSVTFYATNHFWHHYLDLKSIFKQKTYCQRLRGLILTDVTLLIISLSLAMD